MRYELTEDELLVIKQDQIDRDLRVKAQLEEELKAAFPADQSERPWAAREDGLTERLGLVQKRLDSTIAEAKAIEKRAKGRKA